MAMLYGQIIFKEMENVRVAFEILPDGKKAPIGHNFCDVTWYST